MSRVKIAFFVATAISVSVGSVKLWQSFGPNRQAYARKVFLCSPNDVSSILIEPEFGQVTGLTLPTMLSSTQQIAAMCHVLSQTTTANPSQPGFTWYMTLRIKYRDGSEAGFQFGYARRQGLLISLSEHVTSGIDYGFYRNEALAQYLGATPWGVTGSVLRARSPMKE